MELLKALVTGFLLIVIAGFIISAFGEYIDKIIGFGLLIVSSLALGFAVMKVFEAL